MLRDDPSLDGDKIVACLGTQYGLAVARVAFLPLDYDLNAAVHEVTTNDGAAYFLKVRAGEVNDAGLLVPQALADLGLPHVLAPLRTRVGALWCRLDGEAEQSVVLYPFVRGASAMEVGLTDDQWRAFGTTLRMVHDCPLGSNNRAGLPVEDFSLPSAALVRRMLGVTGSEIVGSSVAQAFAAFWHAQARRIDWMIGRAEAMGATLARRRFERVFCHADTHAANILVGEDGGIHLVDWDGQRIAPRERDLLFVVGSRIARRVEPREEGFFFEGYGEVGIDPDALAYFRYERIVEDLGEMAAERRPERGDAA